MNKIISDSLIVFLVSFLLITFGGCAEKQNAKEEETGGEIQGETAGETDEEPPIELQYEPIPGILNPWDRWYVEGNIQYIKAPTEKELISDYYGSEYNINIINVNRIEACELAYSCDETFFYIVTVNENDAEKMKELGWKEVDKM